MKKIKVYLWSYKVELSICQIRVDKSKFERQKFKLRLINSKWNLMFYKSSNLKECLNVYKRISIKIFDFVSQSVTSFCVTRFRNSI